MVSPVEKKVDLFMPCIAVGCEKNSADLDNFTHWKHKPDTCGARTTIDQEGNLCCYNNCSSYNLFDGLFSCANHSQYREVNPMKALEYIGAMAKLV